VYYYLSKVADPTLAGDYRNRAVSTLEKARETFTNEIFYHVLVQVYLDTFQTAKAQTEADILLLIKPNDEKTQAHFLAGRVARAAGRYEKAAQHFEREIENNPENDLAHAYLAAIYEEQLGRFKQALRIHLKRLKHNPGQILPHEKIGDLYAGPLDEPQKALPYYQRALKLAQMGERFPDKVQTLQMKINQLQTKTGGRENTSKGNENE
ncbi:tetratricopeptide repeat protein, partial [bacterium]|nr:tetratricopeptide repeat protein [bacterium]